MDSSILSLILKLLDNKDILNMVTSLLHKPQQQNNNFNLSNNTSSLPLYPEPLDYPYKKTDNVSTQNNIPKQNTFPQSNDFSSFANLLSGINLPDLLTKISPLLNLTNSLKKETDNKNNTIEYGVSDIDLDRIIRHD